MVYLCLYFLLHFLTKYQFIFDYLPVETDFGSLTWLYLVQLIHLPKVTKKIMK